MDLRGVSIAIACALVGPGCDFLAGLDDFAQRLPIYFNSFESPQDTSGWQGFGARELRNDAPPGGGNQSLFVSGGCIVPHALVEFRSPSQETCLRLRCWGKKLLGGGEVSLFIKGALPGKGISLSIGDSLWNSYQSADSLICPANQTLQLEMMSGGIIAGAMLVDMVEVVPIRQ